MSDAHPWPVGAFLAWTLVSLPGCQPGQVESRCDGAAPGTERSRTRYESSSVPFGEQCRSETQTQTCRNGEWTPWSGTFPFDACSALPRTDCGAIADGASESRACYDAPSVPAGGTCTSTEQIRWCHGGVFDPDWPACPYLTCSVGGGPSSSKDITGFSILGVHGTIGERTVDLTLPDGTLLTHLTPAVTHTGVSLSPASGVAQDFTAPVVFTVTAEDATTKAYTVTITAAPFPGRTFYVSSSEGDDDAHSGESAGEPWRTVSRVNSAAIAPGDRVLFRRGDVWREQVTLNPASGSDGEYVLYGAYGAGPKPLLLGSKRENAEGDWTEVSDNLWRNADPAFEVSVGNLIFDHEAGFGVKVFSEGDLRAQGDYFWDESNQWLTVFSTENPASRYSDIECALKRHLVLLSGAEQFVIFEDLDLRYGAAHGIAAYSGCAHIIIRDCDFSWIGGADFTDETGPVRYGNAIEFWQDSSDILIERCTFDQIYDAAITPQYSGPNPTTISSWTARYNVIRRSEYSFEMFTHGASGTASGIYFQNNTCLDAGGGFGHDQRPDSKNGRHVMISEISLQISDLHIRNNIFSGATESALCINPADIPDVDLDYNDYDVGEIGFDGSSHFTGLDDWRSASGHDSHSLAGDPGFLGANDLHLAPSSRCIDAGVDVGYTSDFDREEIVDRPDLGAFEHRP